jgi:hypothetical protein
MGGETGSTPLPRYVPTFDEMFFENAQKHTDGSSRTASSEKTVKISIENRIEKQRASIGELSFDYMLSDNTITDKSENEERYNSDDDYEEHDRFVLTSSSSEDLDDELSEEIPKKQAKFNTNDVYSPFTYPQPAPVLDVITYQPAPIDYQSVKHISNIYQPANVTRKTSIKLSAKLSPAPLQVPKHEHQPQAQQQQNDKTSHYSVRSKSTSPNSITSPRKLSPQPTNVLFNNPNKKIYFSKDFLETKCGFSYSSIQQHEQKEIQLEKQIQQMQQRTGERPEELIEQMLVQQQENKLYDEILSRNVTSSDSLIQEEVQVQVEEVPKTKKASEYPKEHIHQTIRQTSPWNEYRSAFSLVRVIASQWSWGEMTLGLEYYARTFSHFKL